MSKMEREKMRRMTQDKPRGRNMYTIVVKMRHKMIRVSKCGKYDPVVRTKLKILHSSHKGTFQIKKCTLRLKIFLSISIVIQ